ncbi:MAG: PglZ domain-containing protein [Truepera sp.]|jgi:hypothetical protein|nr:PglZ domain-containing protein [Truepera sp.]
MSIVEFIRELVLRPRLQKTGCLVVYDADERYRDVCLSLASAELCVVDASASSIESREQALATLRDLGRQGSSLEGLLVYVPTKAPRTEDEKQDDPFAVYAEVGAMFPQDDGDEYLSLCLRSKPDYATEIRKVFDTTPGGPSFAVIDAIGGGVDWPQLRASLKAESSREILRALLAPTVHQRDALASHEGWQHEAREFLRASIGLDLKTRSKSWLTIADELWRYVLFSEFVFDLPVALPEALQGVPHAPDTARSVIEDVCTQLRTDPFGRADYIERAQAIEQDLHLEELCEGIDDLGTRDTFPFEERSLMQAAIRGLANGDLDVTRRVLSTREGSVWAGSGESQAQWELVRAGMSLVESCEDLERQLPALVRTQGDLISFYLSNLREADRLQREFEQAAGDLLDPYGLMQEVIDQARARYGKLIEVVQGAFVKHLDGSGWPPSGLNANADTFDRLVAEPLKDNGRKVAYIMVDALRYELGVALQKMLSEDGPVELEAAYAQLPSVTAVGMASLLPGAHADLTLRQANGALAPFLGENPVTNVQQRMGYLSKRYGDRFAELTLADFSRSKTKVAESVDLLVLRSTEIDKQLETNPETTLGLIPATLRWIRAAIHKLRGMGFQEAIVVTDHGFFLNAASGAGDVGMKPQGNWLVNAHDRMLLGDGTPDGHNLVVGAEKLGIKGDFAQVAMPRGMVSYRSGHLYFHGGASLQEAVVPVLVARLSSSDSAQTRRVDVEVSYKNGANRVTTRVPVIDVTLIADMFSQDRSLEILLEAQDTKGNVVGEPRPGGDVNPASRAVTLVPGRRTQVVMRMDEDFRGAFKIVALNPTTMAAYTSLALETDYVE